MALVSVGSGAVNAQHLLQVCSMPDISLLAVCRCHDDWRHTVLQRWWLHTMPSLPRHGEQRCHLCTPTFPQVAAFVTFVSTLYMQGACQCPHCRGTGKRATWLTSGSW